MRPSKTFNLVNKVLPGSNSALVKHFQQESCAVATRAWMPRRPLWSPSGRSKGENIYRQHTACSSVSRGSQAPVQLTPRAPPHCSTEAPTVLPPRPSHHAVTACTLKRLSWRHGGRTLQPIDAAGEAATETNRQRGGDDGGLRGVRWEVGVRGGSHQGNGHKQGLKEEERDVKEEEESLFSSLRAPLLIVPSGRRSILAVQWSRGAEKELGSSFKPAADAAEGLFTDMKTL